MPGGNDSEFNALYAIACSTAEMAVAAGGIGQNSGFVTEDDLVNAIACNLSQTVLGLSGDPCNYGWTDTDGAWLAILFYSGQLTGLTGTELNAGSTASLEGILYGIACDLDQVATNTGQAAGGVGTGTYLDQLNAIACISAQIVENGFAPPDPVQEFIDALNAFNPDVLLVGDRGTSTLVNGQPVSSWADQSGNGSNAAQVGTARPTLLTGAQNGKTALSFDGVNDFMLGAFSDAGATLTDIVVYRANAAADSSARITAVGPTGVDEAGTALGAIVLRFTGNPLLVGPFYALSGQAGSVATTRSAFHATATVFSGATATVTEDGVSDAPFGVASAFGTDQYALAASIAGNSFLRGEIAFRAIWAADKTSDLAAILAIIQAYYATP